MYVSDCSAVLKSIMLGLYCCGEQPIGQNKGDDQSSIAYENRVTPLGQKRHEKFVP